MDEDEPGPEALSSAAFYLHREGCACIFNVTVPAFEAPSTVGETELFTELAKDLAKGPGSLICVQRATQSMVTQLNALPPPTGYAQKFFVLFRGGLLIAARTTLAMAIGDGMLQEWPDLGVMLVGDVHLGKPVAGFQVLTVANISMHSHGSGDDGTSTGSLKAMADDIVGIIENRGCAGAGG